jgi:hypothetical protein
MKCHWTGEAAFVVAWPLLATGILLALTRRRETSRALAIIGLVLGAVVIALPTRVIGVCASEEMVCNMIMQPVLVLAGALTVVASVVALLLSTRSQPQEEDAATALEDAA